MAGINNGSATINAIFALDIVTSALAFLCLITVLTSVTLRLINGRVRSRKNKRTSSAAEPLTTTFTTLIFLFLAFLTLTIAYAVKAAIVALQFDLRNPIAITLAYSYPYDTHPVSSSPTSTSTISILTFTQSLASILFTFALTGAVWLHSNNLTSSGTGANSPGPISRLWNSFILTSILAFGLAPWGLAISQRSSSSTDGYRTYSNAIDSDHITRILYITFCVIVIFASTSVTIQVLLDYFNLRSNSVPSSPQRPIQALFTYLAVPVIWLRNIFIIVNIVVLYESTQTWSRSTNQALAFLSIVFGQLANLFVVALVLWGSWRVGRSAGKG